MVNVLFGIVHHVNIVVLVVEVFCVRARMELVQVFGDIGCLLEFGLGNFLCPLFSHCEVGDVSIGQMGNYTITRGAVKAFDAVPNVTGFSLK